MKAFVMKMALVIYDTRMTEGAALLGFPVVSPD